MYLCYLYYVPRFYTWDAMISLPSFVEWKLDLSRMQTESSVQINLKFLYLHACMAIEVSCFCFTCFFRGVLILLVVCKVHMRLQIKCSP